MASNASVEAAHVGALGKGFDVVVGEMRKLTVEGDESAKTIKDLSSKVQHVIIQMDEKTQAVDRTAKSQEASIQEIAKASLDLVVVAGELVGISNYISNE